MPIPVLDLESSSMCCYLALVVRGLTHPLTVSLTIKYPGVITTTHSQVEVVF